MNKFAGLPFMCLIFLSAHANPDGSGSNWSLQLSQNNGESVQVQMEGEEFDKDGVTSYKSEGTIEDGVYKPTNEFKDFSPRESQFKSTNKLNRESRDIDALLKIGDRYGNEEMDFQKDEKGMKYHHGEDFGANVEERSLPSDVHHPRHHGKRKHFRKYNPWKFLKKKRIHPKNENFDRDEFMADRFPGEVSDFGNSENQLRNRHHSRKHFGKHRPWKFLKKKHFHSGPEKFSKEKSHYARIPDSESKTVSGPETTENELKNFLKFLQMENIYPKLVEFVKGPSHYVDIPDSESEAIKNRFMNRSRISPMDRLKEYWKKLSELKKRNSENEDNSNKSLKIIRIPARPLPSEEVRGEDFSERDNWFEDFERQNPKETEELLESMREFENGILNEYYDAEK